MTVDLQSLAEESKEYPEAQISHLVVVEQDTHESKKHLQE